eukprot:365807-Chlamydomonas_euryale.AAC.2
MKAGGQACDRRTSMCAEMMINRSSFLIKKQYATTNPPEPNPTNGTLIAARHLLPGTHSAETIPNPLSMLRTCEPLLPAPHTDTHSTIPDPLATARMQHVAAHTTHRHPQHNTRPPRNSTHATCCCPHHAPTTIAQYPTSLPHHACNMLLPTPRTNALCPNPIPP